MIDVTFNCGGCDASVTVRNAIHRRFVSISGRSYGIGRYHVTQFEDAAPAGWVAFDPYTQVTYCPECWADIEHGEVAAGEQ